MNSRTFQKVAGTEYEDAMTVRGAVNKTAILLTIVALSATWGWLSIAHDAGFSRFTLWLLFAIMAAFVVALITTVHERIAPFTARHLQRIQHSTGASLQAPTKRCQDLQR